MNTAHARQTVNFPTPQHEALSVMKRRVLRTLAWLSRSQNHALQWSLAHPSQRYSRIVQFHRSEVSNAQQVWSNDEAAALAVGPGNGLTQGLRAPKLKA